MIEPAEHEWIGGDKKRRGAQLSRAREGGIDLAFIAYMQDVYLLGQGSSCFLNFVQLISIRRHGRVEQNPDERGETAARSLVPNPRNDQAARDAFPSAANSRNKILAINVLLDPPNCLLLLSYRVQTVTNPSRDVLYKPATVWPLSSAVICFQRISSPMR